MFSLKKYYGPRLKILHRCTDQAITKALTEMDLTAAQGHILAFLSHQPDAPCPKDIETVFHLSHPTVSGLLSRLEKKDFIAIRPDPQDRRCKRIYLMPKGEACHRKMEQVITDIEHRLIENFSAQEQEAFVRLLDRAIENMGGNLTRPCSKEES